MSGKVQTEKIVAMLHAADHIFQPDVATSVLTALANTPSPGQTVQFTRAMTIKQLLDRYNANNYLYSPNYGLTGNALLSFDPQDRRLLFFAHGDEVSYLFGPQAKDGTWPLVPNCFDASQIEYEAIAVRYQPAARRFERVAHGLIKRDQGVDRPYFQATTGSVEPGDRLVYHRPLTISGDTISGSLDNSFAVAACLLAIIALSQSGQPYPVAFAFTDEEQGVPSQNASFGRGARRLLRRLAPPNLCITMDTCSDLDWCQLGQGIVFSEKTSLAKGAVVPPHLYVTFKALAAQMTAHGVPVSENPGYISRNDDVATMEVTPNTLLLSYPIENPLFQQGPPTASLSDLLTLAKVVFWTALAMSNWPE